MGNAVPIPSRPAVPNGVIRICVSGFGMSHHTGIAQKLATVITQKHPDQYEPWFYFSTMGFRKFLKEDILPRLPDAEKAKSGTSDKGTTIAEHHSSPFIWLEETKDNETVYTALGGRDMFCEWADKTFPDDEDVKALTAAKPGFKDLKFDNATTEGK